jgi:cell division protein ZapA
MVVVLLAALRVDEHGGVVQQAVGEVVHVGDIRLFLMAGLMLADELHEVRLGNPVTSPVAAAASSDGVAEALNAVAARLEKIAQGL